MAVDIVQRLDRAMNGVVTAAGYTRNDHTLELLAVANEAITEIQRLRYTRDQLLGRIARLEGMP